MGVREGVSPSSSAHIKAEADMAALIVPQKLLKEKHALEEQEEQLRKRKDHLDLETEIATSVAKVNVLRACEGPRVSSSLCGKSDGMNSYLEREQRKVQTLNADAETIVPVLAGLPPHFPADYGLHPHLPDVRPKVRNVEMQSQATLSHQLKPEKQHCGVQDTQTCPHFQYDTDHPAPLMQNGSDCHLKSVLEKQNEMTSLLVEQQSLSFLPLREIQIFNGDPLQCGFSNSDDVKMMKKLPLTPT